ncbi:precorrin-6y C5,15-methyltransferase (decarboxylating) subunit CbiE [Enterobacter sp. 10-1]|uniref:cobalt-precorrin-7 (C(5))-methyltransferase n=1 Tax=Raoultella TaxID=160674 RepID=UPI000BA3342D|nr:MULTISPECIES: cobalt-precorrin-7 (C(5))-methyltransferase [Enterobacteriaceae]MVT02883.1 cobalt-precorrin-7 (C(5))-methyltransferase [Raoultella sp. 10-1]PAC12295.1 precorrin-6y C5,15-methyltransferase (decarboxylating) subunit CbiE [Enterobacter sp. 10-1]
MLTVVGMGPSGLHLMTPAAREAVAAADALVGGQRHLQQFPEFRGERFALGANIPQLLAWLGEREAQRVVVLASGDPLFYGIGSRLVAHFGLERVRIIPGISAVQYLCARSGIDMNDMWLTSSHGRSVSFDELARHCKVAMVTDARCGPREIAAQLTARGKGYRWMVIGENLAMDNERIHWLPVSEVDAEYEMNAVVILDER